MNNRWKAFVCTMLVALTVLAIVWQFSKDEIAQCPGESVAHSLLLGQQAAGISNIVERENLGTGANGRCRHLDLVMPADARIFMVDMTGPTNYDKIGHYLYLMYYLFPRAIGVSIDRPTWLTDHGFLGNTCDSNEELLAHGYDVRVDIIGADFLRARGLHALAIRPEVNPSWFDSPMDWGMAFLLPLLTALAGMWLVRFLVPDLSARMPLFEQLACALGLGMMAVAALTLGIKLCGFSGGGVIFIVVLLGAGAALWWQRKKYAHEMGGFCRNVAHSWVRLILLVAGLAVFCIVETFFLGGTSWEG